MSCFWDKIHCRSGNGDLEIGILEYMTEVLYAVRLNIEAFDDTTTSPFIGAVFYMYMETRAAVIFRNFRSLPAHLSVFLFIPQYSVLVPSSA